MTPTGDVDGPPSFVDFDTPDEVDAVFRGQRRAAFGHFALFVLLLGGALLATLSLSWWTNSTTIAGLSPAFLAVGAGLYVVFVAVALSAVTLANAVEDSMMGSPEVNGSDTP